MRSRLALLPLIVLVSLAAVAGAQVDAGGAGLEPVAGLENRGQAASMATVLLAAGTPGKRHALPHSRMMVNSPACPCVGRQRKRSRAPAH